MFYILMFLGTLESSFWCILTLMFWPFDWSGQKTWIRRWLFGLWGRRLCSMAGMHIEVIGRENIPKGPVIVCANHQSMFDTFAINGHYGRVLVWMSKYSLQFWPPVGWAIKSYGTLFLKRDGSQEDKDKMNKFSSRIRPEGLHVMIFPEGTRSRDGVMKPFKKGAFHLAKEAGVPILPLTIRGTNKFTTKGSRWKINPIHAQLIFSPLIDEQIVAQKSVDELTELCRSIVASKLI